MAQRRTLLMVENMNPQLLNGGVTNFSLHLINIEIS